MHTHHKILWSIALLACGSFLTPVKGSPPIENNLTQAVSSVSTAVGKFDELLPNNVHSQLTIIDLTDPKNPRLGAIPRLFFFGKDDNPKTLARAIESLETAVGVIKTDIETTIRTQASR